MSPTLDTPVLDEVTLEVPATEIAADPSPTEFPSEIEPTVAHVEGETVDSDAFNEESTTLATAERTNEAQHNGTTITEKQAPPKGQRSRRRTLKFSLPVPIPPASELAHGQDRKIGRRIADNNSQGLAVANSAKEKISKAKSAKKTKDETDEVWQIQLISVDEISPNPFQPREEFSETEMEELANSVAEHGVQTPILVRTIRRTETQSHTQNNRKAIQNGSAYPALPAAGESVVAIGQSAEIHAANGTQNGVPVGEGIQLLFRFELVAGERRLRASRLAGRKFIRAIVRDDLSDSQAAEIALIENVQRSNLNIIEEARGYKRLMLRFRFTEARIAKKVGKTVPTIQAAIKLLDLPEEVQTLILKRQLTAAHGHELLKLAAHPVICTSAALVAVAGRLPATSLVSNPLPNVRELKRRGRVAELGFLTKFDWRSVCRECPFKAFVTSGYGSYCLLPEEWKKKQTHAIEMEQQEAARVLAEARQQGAATVDIDNLPQDSYRNLQWGEPPAGCSAQCPCRGQAADPRDASKSIPICLNPERVDELRKAQREAQNAERQRHYNGLWEGAVQRLSAPQLPTQQLSASLDLAVISTIDSSLVTEMASDHDRRPQKEDFKENPEMDNLAGATLSALEESVSVPAGMESRQGGERALDSPIAWNKLAPLLVLPVLRGENCSYSERGEWFEKAQEAVATLGLPLPWDDIMSGEEETFLLQLLEPMPPLRLLLLGAVLLLHQETIHASRWAGKTPFLDFVLDLQPARQSELEVSEDVPEVEREAGDRDDDIAADEVTDAKGTDEARSDELIESGVVDGNPEAQIETEGEESEGNEPDGDEPDEHEHIERGDEGHESDPDNLSR